MKSVAVFRHLIEEDLGTFARTLEELGYSYTYIDTPDFDFSGFDVLAPDILIVMGGTMGVYETNDHPYLAEEINLIKTRIDAGLPVLGVCLGAQLIAASMGAKVYKGDNGVEIGWHTLALNDDGRASALAHLSADKTNMFHWHGDTFELPEGAILLASSENYAHQAFSYGDHVLALQFHPEVNEQHLGDCFEHFTDDMGENPAETLEKLRKDTAAYSQELEKQNRLFLTQWLNETAAG